MDKKPFEPILMRECWENWTPEDREHGETFDRGMVGEHSPDFAGMVRVLQSTFPSVYPLPEEPDVHVWYWYTYTNYRTGIDEVTSYHPVNARTARYMAKAWRAGNPNR